MTYSYGRALQQSALNIGQKILRYKGYSKKIFFIEQICAHLQLKVNGQKNLKYKGLNLFI